GQDLLLHKKIDGSMDILKSELDGLEWLKPEAYTASINNNKNNETFASHNFNNRRLYYITDRSRGGNMGGKDIYFSGIMDRRKGYWGQGKSAGRDPNSKVHEGSVYMHPNGKIMYFSSQGHNSMGGYDIFVSKKVRGNWKEPENMGYPINSPYDDKFFAATANKKYAYIASNRPGGKGKMDLYKVTFWGPEKQVSVDTENKLLASVAKPVKESGMAEEVEVEERNSLTVFKGKIIDALTKDPVPAKIKIIDNEKGEVIRKSKTNSATGKFLVSLKAGTNYGIAVKADGYLFHSENFNVPKNSTYKMVNKTIKLKNIEVGSKIALRNVFFETGEAEIKNQSDTELDRLVKLLKDVPSLEIELGGHTDNTGNEKVNKKLSQKRAEAVVEYLVDNGIDKSRLSAKGYGSSKPIATNDTPAGRQKNRRTEFIIKAN
ncbi:MAG: OmpA family protein, partial [Flavobacteriales bacterium]